ncbi:MAG: efflux RND transporter periplasmic adaptor subunit [Bacteroidetes bacterium]|nr:MAG: efflux RND transporter periplasmic adaptor subunit [Bacteroidota bacterium]
MNVNTLIVLLLFLYACNAIEQGKEEALAETELPPAAEQAFPVDTLYPRFERLSYPLQAGGRVYMQRELPLSFAQGGLLSHFALAEGQGVRKGQLLARLDTSLLALERRRAHDALLKARIDRQDRLILHRQGASDSLNPEQQLSVDIASGYRQAQTELQAARLRLQQASLYAPFSGLIADIKARPGQQVQAGEPLATLIDPASAMLRLGLLESELPHLYTGQPATISLPALPHDTFQGQVAHINPRVEEDGLIYVLLRILQPSGRIFPGMHAEVLLHDRRSPPRLLVPAQAVLQRSGKAVVFTYENGLAKWKYVTTGRSNGQWTEILDGLQAGIPVIVSGHLNLGHDARVRLKGG